jgi:hypothetical protein
LWELWLVGIVFSNLWDGLGVAERITQAINMTPSNSFFLALQMCVFKVLNKQVRRVDRRWSGGGKGMEGCARPGCPQGQQRDQLYSYYIAGNTVETSVL